MKVEDGHQVYIESYGNIDGVPVLFLHGGPGLGCKDTDKDFFNPEKFYLIFFDQRGAGKSLPYGSLKANTTQHLLDDILRILDYYELDKVVLFGGSWGSTLALLFAIAHPERVSGMVLRGFFPANRRCTDYFEKGGTQLFFPEAWERYIGLVPDLERVNPTAYYFKMMQSEDATVRKRYAYEYQRYGAAMMKLEIGDAAIETLFETGDFETKARIQAYYSINHFFIPDEYIFDNIAAIKTIPTWIIHGRYDMICPPIYAYELYHQLSNAHLKMVLGGHIASDPNIKTALQEALNELLQYFGK